MTRHHAPPVGARPDHTGVPPAVAAALAELGEGHFPIRVGTPASTPDETWYRFDALTTADALRDRLAELVVDHEDRHVATAFLAARLLSPLSRLLVRPLLEQGRGVIVDADGVWLRRHPRGWHNGLSLASVRLLVAGDDPLAVERHVEVVDDEDARRRRAVGAATALAAPVVERLREVGALGHRALWGQLGDAVVGAVARRRDADGDAEAVRAEARALLDLDGRLWVDPEIARVEADGFVGLAWRRDSCCLAYRLERFELCTGCPLLPRDEWWQRSVASVRERAQEGSA